MKLAFTGGGDRCLYAADYLKKSGFDILYINSFDDMLKLKECSAVILGVVSVDEDGKISGSSFDLTYTEAAKFIPETVPLIGGRLPLYTGHKCVDVLKREDFAMLNAALTAEGAIALTVQNTNFSIFGSNVLICGFGRIGKLLAQRLSVFGCKITCSMRKSSDFALCTSYGYNAVYTEEIAKDAEKYDIIFNTVPSNVIDETVLLKLKKDAVITELASKPGGVCREKAKSFGVKVIDGGSLPGKFSPVTAGKIYGLTIENILKEGV